MRELKALELLFVALLAAGPTASMAAPLPTYYTATSYTNLYAVPPGTSHNVPTSLGTDLDTTAAYLSLSPVLQYTQSGVGSIGGLTPQTISLANGGIVSVGYNGDMSQDYLGLVSATLAYQFRLDGPTSNSLIPVTISGLDTLNANSSSFNIFVFSAAGGQVASFFSNYQTGSNYNFSASLMVNTTYNIVSTARLDFGSYSYFGGPNYYVSYRSGRSISKDGNAPFLTVDPHFAVDPAFSSLYSVETSLPQMSPTGAVPEVATWAMMIFGMAMIGIAMRRRQKVSTPINFAEVSRNP